MLGLIQRDGSTAVADEGGRSPLHFLSQFHFKLKISTNVQLLLNAGAQIELPHELRTFVKQHGSKVCNTLKAITEPKRINYI